MRGKKNLRQKVLYIPAFFLLAVALYPYLYMVFNSLAPWDEVDKGFLPHSFTLRSYKWLLFGEEGVATKPWIGAFLNSFLVTTVSTLLMMVFGALIAYALAKVDFRGRRQVHSFIMFQMFFPTMILLIPTFLVVKTLGFANTYLAMIVPKALSLWAVFLYTNFFKALPDEIVEAARIDGAGTMRIIWSIVLPMSRSITTIIFLFLFMERWVELLWDMIAVKDIQLQTINVLLAQMFGPYEAYPGPMYAGTVILTFPILILFIIFRKNFTKGIQFVLK